MRTLDEITVSINNNLNRGALLKLDLVYSWVDVGRDIEEGKKRCKRDGYKVDPWMNSLGMSRSQANRYCQIYKLSKARPTEIEKYVEESESLSIVGLSSLLHKERRDKAEAVRKERYEQGKVKEAPMQGVSPPLTRVRSLLAQAQVVAHGHLVSDEERDKIKLIWEEMLEEL